MAKLNYIIPILTLIVATFFISQVSANPPLVPTLTIGTITDTTIELSWTETAINHNHNLFRCDNVISCDPDELVGINVNSPYLDSNLEPNKLYRYKVVESHGPSSAISNIVEGTTTSGGGGGGLCQGNTGNQGNPPKVDIFAREISNNAILVTWENPNDGQDCIRFQYTISRDVNKTETFQPIFSSLREVEEKIIDQNGRQMFFYLDKDVNPNTFYTYQVSAGNSQGNPNPVKSDDTRPIFIYPKVTNNIVESKGHLIIGRTLEPVSQITPVFFSSWIKPQLANAENYPDSIFITSINPTLESYRMALEPIPSTLEASDCNQSLEILYQKNAEKGQEFDMTVSIFEKQTIRDDSGPNGEEVESEIEILRHQKDYDGGFTDSDKLKQKWLVIYPEEQTIFNFEKLEVQIDISGKLELLPENWRSFSLQDIIFYIPTGVKSCQ